MKNSFMDGIQFTEQHGPQTYGPHVRKLRQDFNELTAGKVSETDAVAYVRRLMEQPQNFGTDRNVLLWALGRPTDMPSDGCEEFVCQPTYLATSFIVYAVQNYDAAKCIPDIFSFLHDALNGCLWGGFGGHGYEYVEGLIDTMSIFANCGMGSFLDAYPQINEEFKNAFEESVKYIEEELCTGKERNKWNNKTYESEAIPLLKKLKSSRHCQLLFVYGTLMHSGHADYLLSDCEFMGKAVLYNYAMYDLVSYPGIVSEKGEWVEGELYKIRSSDLARLDQYESEGELYHREIVTVECASCSQQAWTYVYLGKPKGIVMHEPWIRNDEDMVWYAGYGSNLSKKRFMRYIEFCTPNYLISDDEDHAWFPGRMYFGNESGRWNHKGVAFYDPKVPGKTFMRLYKVTRKQLEKIQDKEGRGFYGRKQNLGIHPDGCPIYTLTSDTRFFSNSPDESYFSLILRALIEENGFTETEAKRYLEMCLKN